MRPNIEATPFVSTIDGVQVGQQGLVTVATARVRAFRAALVQPVEMPVGTELQHLAGHAHGLLILHLANPGVPRSVTYA